MSVVSRPAILAIILCCLLGAGVPDGEEEARKALEDLASRYRSARTYQGECLTGCRDVGKEGWGPLCKGPTAHLLFERPNRFRITTSSGVVCSDGKTLWSYVPSLNEYSVGEAPATIDLEALAQSPAVYMIPSALHWLLSREGDLRGTDWTVVGYREVAPETFHGMEGLRIQATADSETYREEGPVPFSIWMDGDNGLPAEIAYGRPGEEVELIWRGVLDEPINPGRFVFHPLPVMKKVEAVRSWSEAKQMELLGEAFPAIEGVDLGGKPTLILIWNMDDKKSVEALSAVQKLSDRIPLLGIHIGSDDKEREIREFLVDQGIEFQQILDTDSRVPDPCDWHPCPCTFLVDDQRKIQDIRFIRRTFPQDLSATIERVLRGEDLFEEQKEEEDPLPPTTALQEIDPERFVEIPAPPVPIGGFWWAGAKPMDPDGDGEYEIAVPGGNGGLLLLSADGSTHERIILGRISGATYPAHRQIVVIDGKRHWLYRRSSPFEAFVVLQTMEGEEVWRYPLGPGANSSRLAFGDLDGDGEGEIVVGMEWAPWRPMTTGWSISSQGGTLLVLDSAGKRLCQRPTRDEVEGVDVLPGPPGEGATILCFMDGEVRRYRWAPGKEEKR